MNMIAMKESQEIVIRPAVSPRPNVVHSLDIDT